MKNKLKLLIIPIAIISMFASVLSADALTLTKGSSTEIKRNGNVTEIPLNITIEEGDDIASFTMDCSADNSDVECTIEENKNYGTYVNDSAFFKPVGASVFPVGEMKGVFTVVLTNNATSDKDVIVNLERSYYTKKGTTEKTLFNENSVIFSSTVKAKEKEKSNVAKAKNIKFSKGTLVPEFNPDVTDYTVYNIQDTINSVIATYECLEGECSNDGWVGGKSVDGDRITLNQGENKVSITIFSESGTANQTYNFNIIRGDTNFNSSKLSGIDVGDYILTPAFNKNTLEYTLNVPNKIDTLKGVLVTKTQDEEANVTIEGYESLTVGENTIKITVDNKTATDSTTYVIKVTRMNVGNVEVTNYLNKKVTFLDSENVKTTMNEDEFKVQYPEEYEKITNGTYEFDKDGNRKTAEKDEETTSKKEDTDKKEKKDNKMLLIIILIVVGLLVIIISGILIFKKKPEDKEAKDDSINEENIETNTESRTEVAENSEEGIEENIIKEEEKTENTVDIDEALQDLMSTKQYNLNDLTGNDEE